MGVPGRIAIAVVQVLLVASDFPDTAPEQQEADSRSDLDQAAHGEYDYRRQSHPHRSREALRASLTVATVCHQNNGKPNDNAAVYDSDDDSPRMSRSIHIGDGLIKELRN